MKRTIIVITLALLMVASIFADATKTKFSASEVAAGTASVSTTVELDLQKTPTYIFGITTGALSGVNSTDPSATAITNTDTIAFTRSALTFKDSVNNYYLSFVLYEYDAVDVTLTLNGNMKHSGYASAATADKANYEIPYTLTVAAGKDTNQNGDNPSSFEAKTLKSDSTTENVWEAEYSTPTTKLGEYNWATLKLTFASTSDTALNGKATGKFSNTVTIKIASNS